MIITKKWIENQLKFCEIKKIVGLQRNHLSLKLWTEYCFILFQQVEKQKTFINLHQKFKRRFKVEYSTFMHHLHQAAKLIQFLNLRFNKTNRIKPTRDYNIVDSTLIPTKNAESINGKDYVTGRVTLRPSKIGKGNYKISGFKGLVFLNSKKQIVSSRLLNINTSDHAILKDSAYWLHDFPEGSIVLADRGFSSKLSSQRVANLGLKLLSPPHYKQATHLTQKEWKIYSRRWAIETTFQKMKYAYSECKLVLRGKTTQAIKTAQFYCAVINYNCLNLG